MAVYFPPRPEEGRFASRSKINVPSPSSAALRPRGLYAPRGAAPAPASGTSLAIKAARGGSPFKEDRP
jgi:hypothetical protein